MASARVPASAEAMAATQRGVVTGMVGGISLSVLAVFGPWLLNGGEVGGTLGRIAASLMPRADALKCNLSDRLAHALRWDLLLVLPLAASIGRMAGQRFFSPADINGAGLTTPSDKARVFSAIIQNSHEQLCLALPTHLIWSQVMPFAAQASIPASAILFFAGRVTFAFGYERGAVARSLGFAVTFYPTMLMLGTLCTRAVRSIDWQ